MGCNMALKCFLFITLSLIVLKSLDMIPLSWCIVLTPVTIMIGFIGMVILTSMYK